MLKLGYKASAEQFGPSRLLDFAVRRKRRLRLSVRQRSFPALEAYRRPRAVLARLARRARRAHLARHHRHERAHAHLPLSSLDRGAGVRHARRDVPGTRDPRRRHRRIAERGAVDRHAWPEFKERFARLREAVPLIRKLWSEERVTFEGQYYRTEKPPSMTGPTRRCRSMSRRRAHWSRNMPAGPATASSAPAARRELYTETLLPNVAEGLALAGARPPPTTTG